MSDSNPETRRPPCGLEDEELVRRIQDAPESPAADDAASELFERYKDRVYLWCLRRVCDHEMAVDLAQEIMITAYRSVGGFQGRCQYSTWLFIIARNHCFRALRRPRLIRDEELDPDLLEAKSKDPATDLEDRESEDAILTLMNEVLSADERLAIWLRCYERLPVDEVTRRLDNRLATGARGVLQRARRKLRAALEQRAE